MIQKGEVRLPAERQPEAKTSSERMLERIPIESSTQSFDVAIAQTSGRPTLALGSEARAWFWMAS